ncbi:MAG: hypothetical protein AAGG08_15430 [Actinomycetota bacterium]
MQSYLRPLFVSMAVVLAACGSDGTEPSTAETAETTETTDTASTTASASASPSGSEPAAGPAQESEPAPETTAAPTTEPMPSTTAAPEPEPEPVSEESGEIVEITVGVPFGIVQIAALGGIEQAPALDGVATASTISIMNPDELRTGFATGELDVAMMPTNVAAVLSNREIDVRIVSIVDAQLLQVLGPAGSEWSDLVGQTVHIPFQGDIADVLFRTSALDNGVDPDTDLDLVYGTSLPDLVGAAATGEVTHAVLPQHFATAAVGQAMGAGLDLVPIIDLQDAWATTTGGDRLPQIALVASGSLVDEAPSVVDAIAAAAASGVERAATDPAAADELAEATGLPLPLVTGVIAALDLDARSATDAAADLELLFAGLFESSPESLAGALPGPELLAG